MTELLLDTLKASAPSRIVCVSSVAHAGMMGQPGELQLDDLDFSTHGYDPTRAYTQSMFAVVLYARHLAKRLETSGVSAFSVHPGWIRSNLVQHSMPPFVQNVLMRPFGGFVGMMSKEDGAQTQLHCLLDDSAPDHSGAYFSQNSILYTNKTDKAGGWPMQSPNPLAQNDELAEALYKKSAELRGLSASNCRFRGLVRSAFLPVGCPLFAFTSGEKRSIAITDARHFVITDSPQEACVTGAGAAPSVVRSILAVRGPAH